MLREFKINCKKFENQDRVAYRLSTKLAIKGENNFYKVVFVKELQAELEAKGIKLNRPFTMTIDTDGLGYDLEKKTIYVRNGYPVNIKFIESSKDYEKKPKFDDIFDNVPNTEKHNDTLKF